jgi:hypothetical protein
MAAFATRSVRIAGPVEMQSLWRVEPAATPHCGSLVATGDQCFIHEQREVLLLICLEGMRYEQVATILDIPVGTVRPAPRASNHAAF